MARVAPLSGSEQGISRLEEQRRIHGEQERIRKNLDALGSRGDEKGLRERPAATGPGSACGSCSTDWSTRHGRCLRSNLNVVAVWLDLTQRAAYYRSSFKQAIPRESSVNEPSTPSFQDALGDAPPGSPIKVEWDFFRRELPRLLAEGHEGRWVLIKGEEIIGLFDTFREARSVGTRSYGLAPMLVQQILRWYKPIRAGNYWRCLP